MIRIAWYSAVVLATLTLLVLLWQFSGAVVLFLLSLALAAAFRPLAEGLTERGLPKGLALTLAYAGVLLVVVGLILLSSGQLIMELQQATDGILRQLERVKNIWLQADNTILKNMGAQLPNTRDLYSALTGPQSPRILQVVSGTAGGFFGSMTQLVIVLVLSLYWSADHVRFERLWLSFLPVESRARARKIWQAIESGIGAYLRREVTLSVLSAISLWLVYQALGVNYPTLLALVSGFVRLIPWLGVGVMMAFPLLAGSALGGWAALGAAALTLLVLVLLETTLGSRIFPRSQYSSVVLVLVVIALADSYGIPGAVLAPMLAVALQILFKGVWQTRAVPESGEASQSIAALQTKMETIRALTTGEDQTLPPDETLSLMNRLERLLEQTRTALHSR